MSERPSYVRIFLTFARNSLVRDMTFRANFVVECISSMSWTLMNLGFFQLVFSFADRLGPESGWGKYEFFVFLATTWIVNSVVQAFFMNNADEFSDLIRTGNLDFALLKPIDTQFLVSCVRVDWSSLSNFVLGVVLLIYGVTKLATRPDQPLVLNPLAVALYPLYVACGVAILYSFMISLAASSIWMGRNQSLYDFWFYVTNFSRYPAEIYRHGWGVVLWAFFTFVVPVLVVVNVPARLLAHPLRADQGPLAAFALAATLGSLLASRWIFRAALHSYRSASS